MPSKILKVPELLAQYGITPRGAIHVGAHDGQEVPMYLSLGCPKVVLFEPQPFLVQFLLERTKNLPEVRVVGAAVGDRVGTATMYTETANRGESSSLLKPKEHLKLFPDIPFDGTIEVPVTTLSEYFKQDDISQYNILNMDTQGYELAVLKGAMAIISSLEFIYSEVHRAEVYEGVPMVEQIDAFLAPFGFSRKETDWFGDAWGEALYVKGR